MITLHKYTVSHLFKSAFLTAFLLLMCSSYVEAQTCPYGSVIASTGYGVSASGAAAGASNATGTILAAGTALTVSNAATTSTTVALIVDMQKWVAQGATITIAWSRSSGTVTNAVSVSNDNITYTALATLSGATNANSVYRTITAPAGGFRYIRILGTAGVSLIDGIRYTHRCYYPARAVDDSRVVLSPGTARGKVGTNDLNYDNDAVTYTLLSSTSNGILTFNATGAYTYKPNLNFQGLDVFRYILRDAGPDGNIATTADNSSDTATVSLRTLFHCDSTFFYVPIPENEAIDFLKDVSPTSSPNADPTIVYIGISVTTDAIVIYDHWEDGYEVDIKAPTQATTQIWGDGDISNGVAPGFPNDILDAGQAIILSNSLSSGHTGSTSYNPNAAASDMILQSVIDYDGKDKVFIGGLGAMTKFAWGSLGTVSVCGASVPETRNWGTSYVLPVGLNTANGSNSFQLASLSIMAKEANTVVSIDYNADNVIDIVTTLGQGETYYVDSRFAGSAVSVNQGATITSTKPVMVNLLTGQYNASPYQSRTYSLTPNAKLSNCYFMPAVPQENMRVFIYNPNLTPLTVTRTTAGGATVNIVIPAKSSNYNDVNLSGLAYKYCSTGANFSILAAVDFGSGNSDWGFIPLPSSSLTAKVLVGFGDGEDPTGGTLGTNNYEQALISVDCNTYVYVDTNGDGVPDKVSFNADVDALDAAVSIGGINYNETTSNNGIFLQAYQTLTVGSTSGSLSGAVFWTKTASNNLGNTGCNLSLVYGQNGGPISAPNIDAGYTVANIEVNIPNQNFVSADSVIVGQNKDSIIVFFSGATAPYRVFWINENTLTNSVFTTSKDSFVIKPSEPGDYLIKLNDANCRGFTQRVTIYPIPSASVSGKLFHDANGKANALIDGVATSTLSGLQIYAYLVNSAGIVFDSCKIGTDGSYSLLGRQNTFYTTRLSSVRVGIGTAAPLPSLPASWVAVAEQFGNSNLSGTGIETGTADAKINTSLGTVNISNVNFAMEKQPLAHNKTYTLALDSVLKRGSGDGRFPYSILLYNASGTADTTVNSGLSTVMPGKVSGYDSEDGRYKGNTGNNSKLALTLLPDSTLNGVLVYNGIKLFQNPVLGSPAYAYWNVLTLQYEIPNFNPLLLSLYLKATNQSSTVFKYTYIDNATVKGIEATYTINYLSPLPIHLLLNADLSGSLVNLEFIVRDKSAVIAYELVREDAENNSVQIAIVNENGHYAYALTDNISKLVAGTYRYTVYAINHSQERIAEASADIDYNSVLKPAVSISPNPGFGEISVNLTGFDSRSTKNIEVVGVDGKLVFTGEFKGNTYAFNAYNFIPGVYMVLIYDSRNKTSISLLIQN